MKRVNRRDEKHSTTPNQNEKPFGWFATKENMAAGWTLTFLTEFEKDWLSNAGVGDMPMDRIFRITSEKGTTLARFNFKAGTVSFFDNAYLCETDIPRFQRPQPYNRVFIDHEYWFIIFPDLQF